MTYLTECSSVMRCSSSPNCSPAGDENLIILFLFFRLSLSKRAPNRQCFLQDFLHVVNADHFSELKRLGGTMRPINSPFIKEAGQPEGQCVRKASYDGRYGSSHSSFLSFSSSSPHPCWQYLDFGCRFQFLRLNGHSGAAIQRQFPFSL